MKAIFKHENVYVLVDTGKNLRENVDGAQIIEPDEKCIMYGGRVMVQHDSREGFIDIDGTHICLVGLSTYSHTYPYKEDRYELSQVVAFLNQIENLGVDAFLENYKNQLVQLKQNVENILNNQVYSYDEYEVKKCQELLLWVVTFIFCLSINMNAGLTNQHYTNAYETIINTYFN
jgi:hypothetical protein